MSTASITFPPRGSNEEIEEGLTLTPKFDSNGLIPCITQDAETNEICMFAFMNAEALALTIETGDIHYYSRSRNKLWRKGEQSGHTQKVVEIRVDCDQDVVLIKARLTGPAACHVGYKSCFFRALADVSPKSGLGLKVIEDGKTFDPAEVYGKK